jgi:NAD(P)H-dependent FMN reductase
MLEAEGVSTTTISLADYQIADCTGCEQCIRKTTWCVLPDASREILSLVLDADGLVLASPVYVGTVTGKLKSLLDKTASWLHRPPAVGLPVLPVVTTAGSGLKRTLAYLSEAVIYWGAHPVSGIRRSATNDGPVQPGELEEFLRCLRTPRERYRPSLRQVMLFQVQKVLAVKVAEIDRCFWREKGWDTTDYYFDCRIGLVKRLLGRLLFAVLMHRIKPTHPY